MGRCCRGGRRAGRLLYPASGTGITAMAFAKRQTRRSSGCAKEDRSEFRVFSSSSSGGYCLACSGSFLLLFAFSNPIFTSHIGADRIEHFPSQWVLRSGELAADTSHLSGLYDSPQSAIHLHHFNRLSA